jgi:uncharacterized RDD family membrane protein YckC
MNEEFNPYAAPKSVVLTAPLPNQELPLASRWHRFVAAFLDSLILMAIFLPLQYLTGTFQREAARHAAGVSMFAFRPENILWTAAGLLIMVGINWNFLLNGQTIGKKVFKIRIDRVEGGPCDRARIITRRIVTMQILHLIPIINFIFILVDCLMIFRSNKRTLHDEFAGTKVVDLRSQLV